jgi:GNAT superfamily N-acetyltransferase
MDIRHPNQALEFNSRNELLQTTLRPDPLPFPISKEYPIVLDPQNAQFSYCLIHDKQIIAHANLWPRHLVSSYDDHLGHIGFVGNVATHPEWQGQGLMTRLLQFLADVGTQQQLEALILWSDLDTFYHKKGYRSCGKEWLFGLPAKALAKFAQVEGKTRQLKFPVQDPDQYLIEALFSKRYTTPITIQRSVSEMKCLLKIPGCDLAILEDDGEIEAFAIIGKGYDMMGVVHEWGASYPDQLAACLGLMMKRLQYPEIYLLAPDSGFTAEWQCFFQKQASSVQSLPLALVKPLTSDAKILELLSASFIWGLDSI